MFLFNFSINNTLYLHVHCPEVKPSLVAISNHGRPLTDFDEVSIGQRLIKTITIQNIADTPLDVSFYANWSYIKYSYSCFLGGGEKYVGNFYTNQLIV